MDYRDAHWYLTGYEAQISPERAAQLLHAAGVSRDGGDIGEAAARALADAELQRLSRERIARERAYAALARTDREITTDAVQAQTARELRALEHDRERGRER